MKIILYLLFCCSVVFVWYYLTTKEMIQFSEDLDKLTILKFEELPNEVQNGFLNLQYKSIPEDKVFYNIDAKNKIKWIENTTEGYHSTSYQKLETKKYTLFIMKQRSFPMVIFKKKLYHIKLESLYGGWLFTGTNDCYLVKKYLIKGKFIVLDIDKYL